MKEALLQKLRAYASTRGQPDEEKLKKAVKDSIYKKLIVLIKFTVLIF